MKTDLATTASQDVCAITWDLLQIESAKDSQVNIIASGIPLRKDRLPSDIQDFWKTRNDLCIINSIVLFKNWIVFPRSIWRKVLRSLHSVHQGVTALKERAKDEVYWPGITDDIQIIWDSCYDCNCTAPIQAKITLFEPTIPSALFKELACDYFLFKGWYYFVAADHLSRWTEIFRIQQGTSE